MKLVKTLGVAYSILFLTSCGFLSSLSFNSRIEEDEKPAPVETVATVDNADGSVTGTLKADSSTEQLINAPSSVGGASVTFPPGALAINADVVLAEGASIANNDTLTELGVDTTVTDSSPALKIGTDAKVDPAQPFNIALALPEGAALNLVAGDDYANLIVLFRVELKLLGQTLTGILPRSALTVEGNKVIFAYGNWGVFQAVIVKEAVKIEAEKTVATTQPILTKAEVLTSSEPPPPTNTPPAAIDDAASTPEDTALVFDVIGNDSDAENDPLTLSLIQTPGNGVATINNKKIRYVPEANWHGTDSVVYKVVDGKGGSATATLTITVSAVNDAPVADNDAKAIPEDTNVIIPVLDNDSDLDGDTLTIASVTSPASGTAAIINGSTEISYTGAPNASGTVSFTYTLDDGNGGTAVGTVAVAIAAVNDTPVFDDDSLEAKRILSFQNISTLSIDMGAADIDGNALSYSLDGDTVCNLSLSVNANTGALSGTATTDGLCHVVVEASDANGGVATNSIDIYVVPYAEQLANLKLWLTAESLVTEAVADGDPVETWHDWSGNGNHATQTAAGNRPILRYSNANNNNKPYLEFIPGGPQYMEILGGKLDAVLDFPERTMIVVGKPNSSGLFGFVTINNDDTASNYFGLKQNPDGTLKGSVPTASSSAFISSATPLSGTSHQLLTLRTSAAGSDVRIDTANPVGGPSSEEVTGSDQPVFIGAGMGTGMNAGIPDYFLHGEISEILVYDMKLSDAEIDSIHSTLSLEYSIETVEVQTIFITNGTYDGNLGGTIGADNLCQTEAINGGLGGGVEWKAFIASDSNSSLADLLSFTGEIHNTNGGIVAMTEIALYGGNLPNEILDVNGMQIPPTAEVWTNITNAGGIIDATADCDNWTSNLNGVNGKIVDNATYASAWLSTATVSTCDIPKYLYCVSQSLP